MVPSKGENEQQKDNRALEKGDGTMSATTQNHAYVYGKMKPGAKEHVMSQEKLKEIVEAVKKYRTDKK